MADGSVTPIRKAEAPRSPHDLADDLNLEADCHLECAKAVADLVGILAGSSTDGSDNSLDELAHTTVSVAMDCIDRNIRAAQELQSKVWGLLTQNGVQS